METLLQINQTLNSRKGVFISFEGGEGVGKSTQIDSLKKESVLITDTVGFIQKLPTHLVKSFRATLEEVIEADILIHVIDSSHDEVDNQVAAVNQILNDIGVIEKTIINVLNKSDINKKKANLNLQTKEPWAACSLSKACNLSKACKQVKQPSMQMERCLVNTDWNIEVRN